MTELALNINVNACANEDVKNAHKYHIDTPIAEILENYWNLYNATSDVSNDTSKIVSTQNTLTPISDKFKQIMDRLQIKDEVRSAMNEWSEEKKIQTILQNDFIEKSPQLKFEKATPKRRKSFTQKSTKRRKSFAQKSKRTKSLRKKSKRRKSFIQRSRRSKSLVGKYRSKKSKNKKNHKSNNLKKPTDDFYCNKSGNSTSKSITNTEDAISAKLEEIMKKAEIPENDKSAMREWSDDKKLEMILQYDFKYKSAALSSKRRRGRSKTMSFKL